MRYTTGLPDIGWQLIECCFPKPGKKINGYKRHLLVDTLGLVVPANIQDRNAARQLLEKVFRRKPRRRFKPPLVPMAAARAPWSPGR